VIDVIDVIVPTPARAENQAGEVLGRRRSCSLHVIIISHIGVIDVTTDVIDVIVRFGSSLPPPSPQRRRGYMHPSPFKWGGARVTAGGGVMSNKLDETSDPIVDCRFRREAAKR
jgi:hypothetical protein